MCCGLWVIYSMVVRVMGVVFVGFCWRWVFLQAEIRGGNRDNAVNDPRGTAGGRRRPHDHQYLCGGGKDW